jgi:transitional endoplasmic reticulum ATPase
MDQIGGLKKVKEQIMTRVVLPLEHPELFDHFNGVAMPKGILLYGPPGTGKTMMMKAIASQLKNCYFQQVSVSDLFQKFYGEGENKLAEVFENARRRAPSIIYIDEIDSIAVSRNDTSGDLERRLVGKLLSEMDGLRSKNNVIVIASTNKRDAIDDAFRRSKRFDYEIEFLPPNQEERLDILQIQTSGIKMSRSVDLNALAERTHGYVGADLYGLVSEAVFQCITRNLPKVKLTQQRIEPTVLNRFVVNLSDFEHALEVVKPSVMRSIESVDTPFSLDDVVGLDHCKQALEECFEWRLNPPEKLKGLNIDLPKNILLFGPPGCGKTMLGKTIAKKLGVNFIYLRSPEIFSKYFGESATNLHAYFRKAKQSQPCVFFIDEIDALAYRNNQGDHNEDNKVVIQLLLELEALANTSVLVIAATNKPDILDSALFRSGRFDYHLYVSLPNRNERIQLFKKLLAKLPIEAVNYDRLADATETFSPADINAAVRFATIEFIRTPAEEKKITEKQLIQGIQKVRKSVSEEMLEYYEKFKENFCKVSSG